MSDYYWFNSTYNSTMETSNRGELVVDGGSSSRGRFCRATQDGSHCDVLGWRWPVHGERRCVRQHTSTVLSGVLVAGCWAGMFEVTAGCGCWTDGDCVYSSNYPNPHGNDESCSVVVRACRCLRLAAFSQQRVASVPPGGQGGRGGVPVQATHCTAVDTQQRVGGWSPDSDWARWRGNDLKRSQRKRVGPLVNS